MAEKISKAGISRRDFVKGGFTTLAYASALAPLVSPSIIRAQNLNSKISLGFIGTGSRGCFNMRAIANHKESVVTDICDIFPPHLEEAKKYANNDKVRAWDNWRKMIEQKDVDAIVVATPLFLHVPMSIASLEAGKHVLSEKSMGLNMSQVNEMMAAAKKYREKVYFVGYQHRLDEGIVVAKQLVDGGSIGKVTQFYVHYDRNGSWRREVPDPKWEQVLNWRLYKSCCGGLLTEVVTHEINQIQYILGTMPGSATFYGNIQVYKDGRENHDSIMGTWEMEDGVIGVGTSHLTNSSQGVGWTMLGTHGTIEFYDGELCLYWEKGARHLDSFGVKHKFVKVELGQSLQTKDTEKQTPAKVMKFEADKDDQLATGREFKHFYDCLLNGAKPELDAESARKTSVMALMAYSSTLQNGLKVCRTELEKAG